MLNIGIVQSQSRPAFIFTVKTDNAGTSASDEFTLPFVSTGTYDCAVNWGDGSAIDSINVWNQAETTHSFTGGAGTYQITITGKLIGWAFNNGGDKLKYLSTDQFGILDTDNEVGAFYGAENHVWNAPDLRPTVGMTELNQTWRDNSALTTVTRLGNFINADITSLDSAFSSDENLDEPSLSNADTSNVTTMISCFNGCVALDQDLSGWNFEAISPTNGLTNFMTSNTALSTANYDDLLISMAGQSIRDLLAPNFGDATWSFGYAGQSRYDLLSVTGFASITDGGQDDTTLGCWLNAHNLLKSSANPSDGTLVPTWSDLSDNAIDATASGAQRPTFKTGIANGQPMVLFDGADTKMDIASDPALDGLFATGGWFICAVYPLSDGEGNLGRIFSQGGGNTYLDIREQSGSSAKLTLVKSFDTDNGAWKSTNLDVNIGQVNIIAVAYDADSAANDPAFYINSKTAVAVTEAATPSGTTNTPSGIQLGNAVFANRSFDGYMGDLAFFKNKVPTTQEISDQFDYLADKYGVTLV